MKPTMGHHGAPSRGHSAGATEYQDNACKHSLLSVIEQQIIPRLLQANSLTSPPIVVGAGVLPAPPAADIEKFALACVHADEAAAHARLMGFRQQGYTTDQLFLQVIAPAARFLGLQWEQDQQDFSQVTLGLLRLHQLSHELGYAYRDGPQEAGVRRRIMLASAPGSQHLLGLTIVSEFFRKERWQVVVEISTTEPDLTQAVSNEWFEVVGLSVGVVEQLEDIPSLIQTLRHHSRNPDLRVLLGGPAFLTRAVEANSLGADGISLDAADAVVLAAKLLGSDNAAS
jgi:methanogenic corrinoid protein MtbC1